MYLESSGAPVDELDRALGLDRGNGCVDVLGHHITTVQHAARHVLAMARVTLHHLVSRLKAGVGDLSHGQLLVVSLLSRDDWSIGRQWEVDTVVRHQVGLELGQIHVQGSVKAQGGGDRADNLADQTVQVGVGRALNVQVATADIVDGFVVDHEGAVRVLQGGVGGQDRVVRLHHGRGDLRSGVDSKLQLGLLAVVNAEALHQQRGESRPGASAEAVEDEEALETGALVGQLADTIQNQVNDLLADGVVATGVVVGCILLASDQLLGVKQLTVCTSTNLICTPSRTIRLLI